MNKKTSHFDAEKKLKETKLKRRCIEASDQIKTTKNQNPVDKEQRKNESFDLDFGRRMN